ncbi:hypothetical protein MATL_G00098110 [Megalops atlanticus]|uniref:Lysosomal acid phosphatase n=1 Tax=Megalops atlanticus TaxID=7932 RepID=A0A9D3Q4L8_MEGAT|nr:hypothetical protein MATL_G00098110 [Megalops atlanticus]
MAIPGLVRCLSQRITLVFLLSLIVCVTLDEVAGDRRLKFVTVLYRHGDRSPIKAYPTDPYHESTWPQGFGQLSQEGMRQHFELGQMLRQRYRGFINGSYNRHEIFVRSTDYDRTLMSAEANLAGMYPPNGSQVFNPSLSWQPIPVHTVPMAEERLLSFPRSKCPRYESLIKETKQTEVFLNVTRGYKDFVDMVSKNAGLKDNNIESVWSIHDTLFCEAMHNLSLPSWVTPEVMKKLKNLKDLSFQVMFGVYKREEKCRLQGGILLNQIVKNISEAADSKSNWPLKMLMYSAHDTTLVALQSALNVFNGIQPPYASCHIFELFQEDNGSFSVAMHYRNDSTKEPYPLRLPGCAQYCPLQDFIHITKPVIPENWEKECQEAPSRKDTEVIIGLTVFSCLLLFLIILLFTVLCRKRDRDDNYRHLVDQGEEHS